MSLIEKALRQLERDKQTVSLSDYSGAARPSAAAEELYEKAEDAAAEPGIEERGEPRPWKQGVAAGAVLVIGLGAAALWYMPQGGIKAPPPAVPVAQLKTVPAAAAAPHRAGAPAADGVLPQPARRDENRDGTGHVARQQAAASDKQPLSPAPPAARAGQDSSGRPETPRLLPATAQRRQQPAPRKINQPRPPAAVARQPESVLKAPRSAANAGAANMLQSDGEDADSLNNRGVQLLEQGAAAQAADCFAQALRLAPDHEKALNNMGLSLYARGRTAEALNYYKRAVKVNPGTIETYVNMGIAFRSRRDFAPAAEAFQKALTLNPAHPESLYNYGLLLKDMGQQEKSRVCFEQFLRTAPPRLQGVADSVRTYLQASTDTQR